MVTSLNDFAMSNPERVLSLMNKEEISLICTLVDAGRKVQVLKRVSEESTYFTLTRSMLVTIRKDDPEPGTWSFEMKDELRDLFEPYCRNFWRIAKRRERASAKDSSKTAPTTPRPDTDSIPHTSPASPAPTQGAIPDMEPKDAAKSATQRKADLSMPHMNEPEDESVPPQDHTSPLPRNIIAPVQVVTESFWMDRRPYEHADGVDRFYISVARKIVPLLDIEDLEHGIKDGHGLGDAAFVLASYLEDIASGLGIWKTVNEECRRRYGVPVPFYDVSTYREGTVNLQDVRLLIWDICLKESILDGALLNPENIVIADAAKAVCDLLSKALRVAPADKRLRDFIHGRKPLSG